jgi:hypothetical protein
MIKSKKLKDYVIPEFIETDNYNFITYKDFTHKGKGSNNKLTAEDSFTRYCILASTVNLDLGREFANEWFLALHKNGSEKHIYILYPENNLTPKEQGEFFMKLIKENKAKEKTGFAPERVLIITNCPYIWTNAVRFSLIYPNGVFDFDTPNMGMDCGDYRDLLKIPFGYIEPMVEYAVENYSQEQLVELREQIRAGYWGYRIQVLIEAKNK